MQDGDVVAVWGAGPVGQFAMDSARVLSAATVIAIDDSPCRSGGIVPVIGVYGGLVDNFPGGAWMNRSLPLRSGQRHVQPYMRPLLGRIQRGEINPIRVITHRLPLAEAQHGYDIFTNKADGCGKVVLKPDRPRSRGDDGSRDEDVRVVDRLDEEVDEAADGGAGRPAPDDLQVEEQGGIERQQDDPAHVHLLHDPEDPRSDGGARCDRPQHRLGAVDEVRLDDDLPRLRSPRQQVVHGALPDAGEGGQREHHHGFVAESGDQDIGPVGERMPLRQDDSEQHGAEDDTVEVSVLLRPAPDDRGIGSSLPDGLDGVVPRAGGDEDFGPGDGKAEDPQRAVEDPLRHGADP